MIIIIMISIIKLIKMLDTPIWNKILKNHPFLSLEGEFNIKK